MVPKTGGQRQYEGKKDGSKTSLKVTFNIVLHFEPCKCYVFLKIKLNQMKGMGEGARG